MSEKTSELDWASIVLGVAMTAAAIVAVLLNFAPLLRAEGSTTATVSVHVTSAGCAPVQISLPILQELDPITKYVTILYPSLLLNSNGSVVGTRGVTSNSTHISFYIKVNATEPTTLNYTAVYGSSILVEDETNSPYGEYPILIDNAESALSNYVVQITINFSTLVSAGLIKADLSDLRFRDSAGNQLPYWFSDSDSVGGITVYVNVPSIPYGHSYIYLQYFNPQALDGRDGDAVFWLFDDFLGTSLNTTKWPSTSDKGSVTVSEGTATLSNNYAYMRSATMPGADYTIVARLSLAGGTAQAWWRCSSSSNGYHANITTTALSIGKVVDGTKTSLASTSIAFPTSTYALLTVNAMGSSHSATLGGYGTTSATDSEIASADSVMFRVGGTTGSFAVDYVAVFQAVSSPPTAEVLQPFSATVEVSGITQPSTSVVTNTTVQIIVPVNNTVPIGVTWGAPGMNASDIVKFVYQYSLGQYFLVLLPIIVLLATAASHTGAVAGAVTAGLCAFTNYALGFNVYNTVLLGWMAAACILLLIREQKEGR